MRLGRLLFLLAVFLALLALLRRLELGGLGGGSGGGRLVPRGLRRRWRLDDLGALLAGALALLDARCLARQIAQVVQLRLVDAAARHDLDLVDVRRVVGEDSLDADAVRDLADRERRARALGDPADADPFERLQASLLAFSDLCPDLDRVTRAKLGKVRLAAL